MSSIDQNNKRKIEWKNALFFCLLQKKKNMFDFEIYEKPGGYWE